MSHLLTEISKHTTVLIQGFAEVPQALNLTQEEFEKRLLEMGLDIGTPVTLLHEGPFGKDPMAIRVRNCYTIALRRSEACAIQVL